MYRTTTVALTLLLLCTAAYPDSWTPLSGTPHAVGECAGMAWGSFPLTPTKDTVYLLCGHSEGSNNKFCCYDISTGLWDDLGNIPVQADYTKGGALCFTPVGDYERLYALSGDNDFLFFRHNSADGTWTDQTGSYPFTHSTGCELSFGGTGSSGGTPVAYVYAFVGAAQTFKRYVFGISPLKGALFSGWESKTGYGSNTGDGSGLAYNTYTSAYEVFGMRGGHTTTFRGYDPENNTWTGLADAPSDVYTGGALTSYGINEAKDTLFALRGDATDDFWRYKISDNSWNTGADDPDWTVGCGASLAYCKKNRKVYCVRGDHTTDFAVYDPYGDDFDGGQATGNSDVPDLSVKCCAVGRTGFVLSCAAITGTPADFAVYDMNGRLLWRTTSTHGTATWCPATEVPAGSYVARVDSRGQSASVKLVLAD